MHVVHSQSAKVPEAASTIPMIPGTGIISFEYPPLPVLHGP